MGAGEECSLSACGTGVQTGACAAIPSPGAMSPGGEQGGTSALVLSVLQAQPVSASLRFHVLVASPDTRSFTIPRRQIQ